MNAIQNEPRSESRHAEPSLAGALEPGVLVLRPGGALGSADARALELLGYPSQGALESAWSELRPRLEPLWSGQNRSAVLDLSGRSLGFDLRANAAEGGVLLVRDAGAAEALEADLRLSALMRSLTQITPAVAHDLRAPINAMVFNVEILKETIAAGKGAEPTGRERQLRYVSVLKEELNRLHREMEIYIAHISPRGDRTEVLDLRELIDELVVLLTGPARKQQVQIHSELPDSALFIEVNRYLFRQALLHLSLAALSGVPKEGELELLLERRGDRAWLRIAGDPPGPEPAAGFDIRFSPAGTVAPVYAARTLVASQGGEVRQSAGEPQQAYEIELTAVRNKE
ncbi:MAG TPA: histidine kinase dimerization/phospho-acceptor domain-containing protein [Thermoanaerobaculia bacterium]|jgi:signal transduction histidine kinase|nr:histidine kinase dimerization/phospho-acceptor domain-containing protein [Thermoanaerobaculia bacterium]